MVTLTYGMLAWPPAGPELTTIVTAFVLLTVAMVCVPLVGPVPVVPVPVVPVPVPEPEPEEPRESEPLPPQAARKRSWLRANMTSLRTGFLIA